MRLRPLPEINAGSMADIAFLLLLFFLVTTTMDAEIGISRKLTPYEETPPLKNMQQLDRNVFEVRINAENELLVKGEWMQLEDLRLEAKKFIIGDPKWQDESMPQGEMKLIPLLGNRMVSKQIISLQNDRATTYKRYIQVQNEVVAAYNEVRNEFALSQFGVSYKEIKDAALDSKIAKQQLLAIKKVFPQRISEAEPVHIIN